MWLACLQQRSGNSNDATKFGGGRPIPDYSNTTSLVYICVGVNFIDTWLNVFANNFAWSCCDYEENMKEIF